MSLLSLLLAADAPSVDPMDALLQYGVLGVFATLLLVYTRSSIKRELDRADRAEAQIKELNDFIRGELLPKQIEATLMHKQVTETLEQAIQLLTEMKIRAGYEVTHRSHRESER